MTVYALPNIGISGQLFHVPGSAFDGGVTAGSAQIISPDPGGISRLMLDIALRVDEFDIPIASWLMSKINGEAIKIRLAPTPQVCRVIAVGDGPDWNNDQPWDNDQPWAGDATTIFTAASLAGTDIVKVDMQQFGRKFKVGHVFGHGETTYLIDVIDYDDNDIATIRCKPPVRKNIVVNDIMHFRPYFIGRIMNGSEIPTPYMAADAGMIQIPRLILYENLK